MLDYKSIVRLKRLGLNNAAIANSIGCKWDSVQRIVSRCENVWGSVDGVPDDLINEEIADVLFSFRKSVDLDYFQPDCEKILEKQRKGYFRNELWTEYCVEAGANGSSNCSRQSGNHYLLLLMKNSGMVYWVYEALLFSPMKKAPQVSAQGRRFTIPVSNLKTGDYSSDSSGS